jgi:hypothetical protein
MTGLTYKLQPDRGKINLQDRTELQCWLKHFGVAQEGLPKSCRQGRELGGRRPQGAGRLADGARYTRDLRSEARALLLKTFRSGTGAKTTLNEERLLTELFFHRVIFGVAVWRFCVRSRPGPASKLLIPGS